MILLSVIFTDKDMCQTLFDVETVQNLGLKLISQLAYQMKII